MDSGDGGFIPLPPWPFVGSGQEKGPTVSTVDPSLKIGLLFMLEFASVNGIAAKLFLDAEELVVFANPVGAAE